MKKLNWILLAPMCVMTTIGCLPITSCASGLEIISHKGITIHAGKFEKGKDLIITYELDEGYELSDWQIIVEIDNQVLPSGDGWCLIEETKTLKIYGTRLNCNHVRINMTPYKECWGMVSLDPSMPKEFEVEYKSNRLDNLKLVTSDGFTIKNVVTCVNWHTLSGYAFIPDSVRIEDILEAPGTFSVLYDMLDYEKHTGSYIVFTIELWSIDHSIFYGSNDLKIISK